MVHWWEIDLPDANAPALVRALAYYRHSAQDRRENSIPNQQDQVRTWALENGVEIIREFCDAGRSGAELRRTCPSPVNSKWGSRRLVFRVENEPSDESRDYGIKWCRLRR